MSDETTMPLDRLAESGTRPDPVVHPETEPFWQALQEGELKVQVCDDCGTYRFPLASVCFNCLSFESTWTAIAPEGTVACAVVVRRATGDRRWGEHVPFLSGLVDLEHDLRLPGRILCTCGEATTRGTAVRAVVLVAEGGIEVPGFAHACVEGDGPAAAPLTP